MRRRLTSVGQVLDELEPRFRVAPEVRQGMLEAEAEFPVATTPYYLSLADPDDPRDPILPQVLPDPGEVAHQGEFDPFLEEDLKVAPGLVHRYPDRVLFLLTNFCSTLCRHCMRKREWREGFGRLSDAQVDLAVTAIAERPQVRDVLLSGGDPLHLPPRFLGRVLAKLRERTDLDCIRFGSRVPVTLPQRIDSELLEELEPWGPLYLNTHFNHARELTSEAVEAVRRLSRAGVIVSNQAVLLREVNDRVQDLLDLSRGLLRAGVRAYYLHHCDPVRGTRHFRVGLARGRQLVAELTGKVSGLAIPAFIVDLPGGHGKVRGDGPALQKVEGEIHWYQSPLSGELVAVDGSEGSFAGAGSWSVVLPETPGYAPRPRSPNARSSNW